MIAERCHKCKQIDTKINNRPLRTEKTLAVNMGRAGNWRSGLGLAYPHFHEDVSVSVSFVWQCITSRTMPYFQLPLIKPYVQFSRIRLSNYLLPEVFAVSCLAFWYSFL